MTRLLCWVLGLTVLFGGASAAWAGGAAKPKKTPEQRFEKADKNDDDKLSLDEFLGKRTEEAKKEKATKRFHKLDKDDDDFLTLEEFKAGGKKKK
ncbi:MAG: hypothetical protein K2Y37_12045 [Pirellulales bacterium]|nr:hypothetical protein [Pirellulales bacterium]